MGGRVPDQHGGTRSTLIEQASGGAWTLVASPNVAGSTDNSLMAVAGTQATGLWAVGYWLSPTGLQPLVLRYDTTQSSPSWVLVGGVPPVGLVDTVLTGVAVRTASDVWAVGYCNDGGADRPVALHWDGITWTSSPVPGAGLLRKVSAVAAGNVWAAGSYYNASAQHYRTLVVHFNGTKWTTVVSANGHPDRMRYRPGHRPGRVDVRGRPGGPQPAHRTGELPQRARLTARPGSCVRPSVRPLRASARRRARRRTRPRRRRPSR